MTSPQAQPFDTDVFELRVLGGPQQGAVLPLRQGLSYSVGTALGADIVLRQAAGRAESRATIRPQADGLWLQALAGEVRVDGRMLPAGEARLLSWACPWQLGEATVAASGPAGAWPLAGADDTAAPSGPIPGPMSGPMSEPMPGSATGQRASAITSSATGASPGPASGSPLGLPPPRLIGCGRRLAAGGGLVAAASLSMWALAGAIAPTSPSPDALAQRAQATLHAAGMTAVAVRLPSGQRHPVVEGYLDTRTQRTRAEALLAAHGLQPRFTVWINETLAQAVQDVYRVHGISAQVEALGPGEMRVSTAVADTSALATVEKTVRRDVLGLNLLDTRNTPPPSRAPTAPLPEEPGKRVASIVAGPEPYVATQDGTRYFIGALLPTGHRILAITDGRVELEREGLGTALTF